MSYPDSEEIPHTSCLDSESDFLEISSVNSAKNPGVNVISPSATLTHEQALGVEDSNATGSASNRGNPVGHVLLEETGSNEVGKLLKAPNHTPPQSKPPSLFSCHRG